ncbi:MAG: hypothetical protein KY459_07370 [Acidobacteria bacterium]|nr:hypothetical protein [Acidobacteriota bacterium]
MRWAAWMIAVFAMHFAWEMAQAKWFANMTELPFWTATLVCLQASAGDVVITLVAFFAAAAIVGTSKWPVTHLAASPVTVYLTTGLVITIVIEIIALRAGRWSYADDMPTIVGIGALPLAQWIILPVIGLALFRLIWTRGHEQLLSGR